MFDFRPDAGTPKPEAYRQLLDAAPSALAPREAVAHRAILLVLPRPGKDKKVGRVPDVAGNA